MRYAIDTEFTERGPDFPVKLISIAIVPEDVCMDPFYAVSADFTEDECNDWVKENVLPQIIDEPRHSLPQIKKMLLEYFEPEEDDYDTPIEFWGYYSDYDWVVFCQIFGTMMDLPRHLPMYCHDLKQVIDERGLDESQEDSVHNALDDADWIMETLKQLDGPSCDECGGSEFDNEEHMGVIAAIGYTPNPSDIIIILEDGTRLLGNNAPTVMALDRMFDEVIIDGDLNIPALMGQEIAYELEHWGRLSHIGHPHELQ